MNQDAYWDKIAWSKEFAHPFDHERFSTYVDKDAWILDLGCGYGRILSQLHHLGFTYCLGLDTSREMIVRGKASYPHLDLRIQEGLDIPFGDGTFDAMILFAVLTCVHRSEDQRYMLSEAYRVLSPGGVLYISDYPLQEDARCVERYRRCMHAYGVYGVFETPDGGIFRHHDLTWVAELTTRFHSLDLFEIDVQTMNGNKAKAFQLLGRKPP